MKEYDIQKLINNPKIVNEKIKELMKKELLFKQDVDKEEINGHILKAEHNLRFVADIIQNKYFDWSLTGCYYSCYHAALALIQTKGYTSKNHLATICIIIKEFYKKELDSRKALFLTPYYHMGLISIRGLDKERVGEVTLQIFFFFNNTYF